MKIVRQTDQSKEEQKKRLPLHKDKAYIAKFKAEFIVAHNKRIQKMIDNGTYDKWIGR